MWLRTMRCLQSKFKPVTYFPLLTKHCPRCFKINNYTTHTYYTIILCRQKLSLTFLPFQSESTIPDQMQFFFFCFESPKLSLYFFNCSCSPIDVKMEQKGQSQVSKFYQLSNIASSPFFSFLSSFFFMFTNFTRHQILQYTKDTKSDIHQISVTQIHTKIIHSRIFTKYCSMFHNFTGDQQFTSYKILSLLFPMMMTLLANQLKIHFLEYCQTNISLTGSQFS